MALFLPLDLTYKKHRKINLISSRFPWVSLQQECFMTSNYILDVFLGDHIEDFFSKLSLIMRKGV